MARGRPMYLCRLCGQRCEGMVWSDIDAAHVEIKKLLNGKESTFTNGFLYTFHDCHEGLSDEGAFLGFCDFIGFRRLEDR